MIYQKVNPYVCKYIIVYARVFLQDQYETNNKNKCKL